MLGFYAVLQIHYQTKIGLDIENGNGVSNTPLLFFFCSGDRVTFKKRQKMFTVKTGSQRSGRDVFFSVREKVTKSTTVVFYQNVRSEVFQVSDIENAVFQALKKELSLLDVLYGDIQKEEQGLKEAHKKASRRKTLMEQELKNLKGEKMRMYEEYAAGTLLLDTYKQKKQECDRRISEVQEQIEQSKVEESTKSVVPGTVRAAAEQAENFLNGTRLTASMVSAFIENVFVYDGGRIVVRFKYEQSIQDAVKALHTG